MNQNKSNTTSSQIGIGILVLSILLAFVVGLIVGYFVGEKKAEDRIGEYSLNYLAPTNNVNSGNNSGSSVNSGTTQEEPTSVNAVDYSKYVINAKLGATVDNYYGDDETKQYAAAVLGFQMPVITWTKEDGTTASTADFEGDYVVEIFSPTCYYCNQTIPELDAFREAHPDYNIVSITNEEGDYSAFNQSGENAFFWNPETAADAEILNYIPWIPCFIYVHEGKVALITYGQESLETLEQSWQVAFDQ